MMEPGRRIAVVLGVRAVNAADRLTAVLDTWPHPRPDIVVDRGDDRAFGVFPSADEAIGAAEMIHEAAYRSSLGVGAGIGSDTRVALDLGDLVVDGDEISGRPVETVVALLDGLGARAIGLTVAVLDAADDRVRARSGPVLRIVARQAPPTHYVLLDAPKNPAAYAPVEATRGLEPTIAFPDSRSREALLDIREPIVEATSVKPGADGGMGSLLGRMKRVLVPRRVNQEIERDRRQVRSKIAINRRAAAKHLEDGQPYEAISIYRRLMVLTRKTPGLESDALDLGTARRLVEKDLYFSGFASLSGTLGRILLRPGRILQICRRQPETLCGVDIGYDLLSRPGHQTRIVADGGRFLIEDLDSRNGTFVGDRPLRQGERIAVDQAVVIALGGGRSPARKGACRLRAAPVGRGHPALLLDLVPIQVAPPALRQIEADWKGRDEDFLSSWLFFSNPVMIGGGVECAIQLVREEIHGPVAEMDHGAEGYALRPVSERTVCVDGVPIVDRVPLRDGAEIGIGADIFTVTKT